MFEIDKSSGQVVAADTQKSVDALDQAVMSMAHLCASSRGEPGVAPAGLDTSAGPCQCR